MKKCLLERSLCPHCDFAKAVVIKKPSMLNALLFKAHAYMQYKEKEAANMARDARHQESTKPFKSEDPSTSRRGGD